MAQFTDTFIKRLKPKEKREEKFEGGGFGILIYPAGTKNWIYRYKMDDKKDYIILGHYPEVSLADARKRFAEFREKRRAGVNPKELVQQQNARELGTVEKLVMEWYTGYVEKHRAQPKQIKQLESVDNSDLVVPRLVRGIHSDLPKYNELEYCARSLDPADKPRDDGLRKMNCQQLLIDADIIPLLGDKKLEALKTMDITQASR